MPHKLNARGEVICHNDDCELIARYTMVFNSKWICFCIIHAQIALNGEGGTIEYPPPENTLRPMTIDEMMPDID